MNPVIRYAFAALLLLGSPFSYAETGTYWETGWLPGRGYGPTAEAAAAEACSIWSCVTNSHSSGTNPQTWVMSKGSQTDGSYTTKSYNILQYSSTTCPPELPYLNESGQCTSEQPVTCTAGEVVDPIYYPESTDSGLVSYGGCEFKTSGLNVCLISPTTGKWQCVGKGTMTGNPASEGSSDIHERAPLPDGTTSTDDSGGETTYTKSPPVTNPDGSTTDTTNETTTNNSGSGTEIWNDDQNIYIRDSTGTTTVYDRQKTQTTNTDGSMDETVVTTKTTQTPSTETTIVNRSNGNTTVVNNNQSTTNTSTTTTINNYDSNGNLTSSESTTEGGSETEGDENEDGNCGAPGQPPCEVKLAGEDQLGDPGLKLEQSGIMGQFDNHITSIEEVGNEDIAEKILQSPFQLPTTGTCNPSSYSFDYHGADFNLIGKFCEAYDSTLHPILQFFFYMFTAISLYFIYLRTIERT